MESFDIHKVRVNFNLGIHEIEMILKGLTCLPKEDAEALFNFIRSAAVDEIEAAKQPTKELENAGNKSADSQ